MGNLILVKMPKLSVVGVNYAKYMLRMIYIAIITICTVDMYQNILSQMEVGEWLDDSKLELISTQQV